MTEKQALEVINRMGKTLLFLSCSEHILDTLEIFQRDKNFSGNLRFYAKGLASESEKAINRFFTGIGEDVEKRTYKYKDLQQEYLASFIGCAAFPELHDEFLAHLKEFNEKHGFEGVEDEEYLKQYGV